MGWEPADNKEHKIINCPVPGCPMANKGESVKEAKTINFIESTKKRIIFYISLLFSRRRVSFEYF